MVHGKTYTTSLSTGGPTLEAYHLGKSFVQQGLTTHLGRYRAKTIGCKMMAHVVDSNEIRSCSMT